MPAFKLTQLRHFSAVAKLKSIGLASRVLHISQPALTRSIQRLEAEAEGVLFERGSRGVELTPRGKTLLPYVKAMLTEADRATEQLRNITGQRRTRIRLGTSPNFTQDICPDIIAEFLGAYPNANILTRSATAEQMIAMLAASELDLAIILSWGTTVQMALAKDFELAHEPLTEAIVSVFAPAGHELDTRTEVSIEELALQRWAVPHGMSLSYLFQHVFASRDLPVPQEIINSSNVAHMLELAQRLNLLLIIPRHLVTEEVRGGKLVPLQCPPLQLSYQVEMITRRRGTKAAGLSHFREIARRHFAAAQLS